MIFESLNDYTEQEIYTKLILPLFERYQSEITRFADQNVWITQEEPGKPSGPGWTSLLLNDKLIPAPNGGEKYVELERMLSSIVYFYLLYDGSDGAYEKFVSVQNEDTRLSKDSFKQLHQLARTVASSDKFYEAVVAMLVYSDLGKTPATRKKAKEFGITHSDHDDFMEALLELKRSDISNIIPSFFGLESDIKDLLSNVASSMKVHLGHVLHLEGGEGMFAKLSDAIAKDKVTETALNFAFLIQLSDVAAAAGQVTNAGSLALLENAYQGYNIVKSALDILVNGGTATQALDHCLQQRGSLLGIETSNSQNQLLIRLACMMRLYSQADGADLKQASEKLSDSEWQILEDQFAIHAGFSQWTRNPTYIPAVLINLARFNDASSSPEEKISRGLKGAVCTAKILMEYSKEPANVNSEMPLCFNHFAGLANTQAEIFLAEDFDPSAFEFDEKNNVEFRQPGHVASKSC